jgi:hypothetical protein
MSLWRSRWALPFSFLVTFLVRAAVWAQARIGGDETFYWSVSRQVARFGGLPQLGPEVSGSAARLPGPGLYLVGAPPFAFFDSIWAGSVYVALLHALGGLLIARLAQEARGDRAGVLAFLAVAVAPWDVLYGDRFWPSNITPIIATLAFYATVRAAERPAALGWAAGLAIFLPQLHLSVPALWAAMLVVVVLRPPPRFPWKVVAIGVGLGAISYAPYLHHEFTHQFANTKLLFANAQGNVAPAQAWTLPAKVLLTAWLYGSAEIGYHFQRGYWAWAGGFDEVQAYLHFAGWQANLQRLGGALFFGTVVSLGLSAWGWGSGLVRAGRPLWARLRHRAPMPLEATLVLSLLAGFLAAAFLLFLGKKPFFPHYANVLMPAALLPLALALDRAMDRRRLGVLAAAAALIAAVSSGVALSRYYGQIDALNGLGPITQMVDRLMAEPGPVQLRFTHLPNEFAWQQIAQGHYGRPLPVSPNATVRYVVHNDRPPPGPLPPGGALYGPVLLVRTPATGDGRPPASALLAAWREVKVEARCDDGTVTSCRFEGERCFYGPNPWQHYGPEVLPIGGVEVPVLFLHPITGCTITAELPERVSQGNLHFALTDPALASSNRAPIQLKLRRGEVVVEATTPMTPGLAKVPLPEGTGPVILELRTEADGARVFGFDVRP